LLDQGLAPRAAALLREEGWEAIHVSEVGLGAASDLEILKFAREQRLVCVTFDLDFHSHLAVSMPDGPSVILLRAEKLQAPQQADLIRRIWDGYEEAIAEGAAVSTDGTWVRLRRLPLK
jgi:predicted nuclease of predicted toxin-antitoxin system